MCRAEAEARRESLREATISTGTQNETQTSKRTDRVEFLKADDALAETAPTLHRHVSWVDRLRGDLESRLRQDNGKPLGMEKSTFMLAEYPGGGTRYVRHRDATPSPFAGRKLTCLYYLNPAWDPTMGGALEIWPRSCDEAVLERQKSGEEPDGSPPEIVAPMMDRLVIFKSALEHAVAPAHFNRIAITAWFVNRKQQALELMCEQLSLKQDGMEARAQPSSGSKQGSQKWGAATGEQNTEGSAVVSGLTPGQQRKRDKRLAKKAASARQEPKDTKTDNPGTGDGQ